MINKKKKAFTLTELLVVVVIIGVLAAVILPKFNKVMETRKTLEAEAMMSAVRTEQEHRCALDKPYIGNMNKLSEIIPQADTKNFTYTLEATGMLASSKGKYSYELKMPSYADGRICCDGAECSKLNKDYPSCTELVAKADYQVATECAINPDPISEKECLSTPETSRDCGTGCGKQTRSATCNHVTGNWEYGMWIGACDPKPATTEGCSPCGGTHTREVTCDTTSGTWITGAFGACSIPESECPCVDEPEEKIKVEACPSIRYKGSITKEWQGYPTCDWKETWGCVDCLIPNAVTWETCCGGDDPANINSTCYKQCFRKVKDGFQPGGSGTENVEMCDRPNQGVGNPGPEDFGYMWMWDGEPDAYVNCINVTGKNSCGLCSAATEGTNCTIGLGCANELTGIQRHFTCTKYCDFGEVGVSPNAYLCGNYEDCSVSCKRFIDNRILLDPGELIRDQGTRVGGTDSVLGGISIIKK